MVKKMISNILNGALGQGISYFIDLFVVACVLLVLTLVKVVFGGVSANDLMSLNFLLAFVLVHGVYNWLFWTSDSRATLGMVISGLKIQDTKGRKLDVVDASLRHVLHYFYPLNLLVNFALGKFGKTDLPIWHEAFSATKIVKDSAKQL